MATSNKNLAKKINPILPAINEKAINKPAKKVLVQKAIFKKTKVEVVKKGLEKSDPIKKTVAKNNFVTAVHSVACGMASQKRSAKKIALVKVEKYKAKPGRKVTVPIQSKATVNDLIQHTTAQQPNKEKSDQPVFTINQKDVYQNKIQTGNKSKSSIKPSGKKPLR